MKSRVRSDEDRLTSTMCSWIIEVDDARWRALVDLLLPPAAIADVPREDDGVPRLPHLHTTRRRA